LKRQRFLLNSKAGFGLLESLIALTVMGLAGLTFSQMMSGVFKGQKRIDQKSQVQDFGNRIRGLLYDERTCTASILNGGSMAFDTADIAAFNASEDANLTFTFGDGSSLKKNSGIDLLNLQIVGEVLPSGSNRFEATLNSGAPGVSLEKSGIRPLAIPLILTTETVSGTSRRITGCYSKGSLDGPATCAAIGGRWLPSLSRCFFGGDLKLGQYECLDPQEFQHGGILEGSVVSECYIRQGAKQVRYECTNNKWLFKWGNQTTNLLPECACQSGGGQAGWVVKSGNNVEKVCDGGAMVRVNDTQESMLLYNEIAENRYVGTTPSGGTSVASPLSKQELLKNYDLLNSVTECFTDPDNYKSEKCEQGDNAIRGANGSCVYVNGAVALGNLGVGEAFVPNYTGWMYVTRARYNNGDGFFANRKTDVIEAHGKKCYTVKTVNSTTVAATSRPLISTVADPSDASIPNILVANKYQNVAECTFLGGSSGTLEPAPIFAGTIWAPSYGGRYLARYNCDQQGVSSSDLVGGLFSSPSLHQGSCWYFKNVSIPYDYAANTGVTYSGGKATYTGWMYLTNTLTGGKYTADSDLFLSPAPGASGHITWGIPCNAGVRMSQ